MNIFLLCLHTIVAVLENCWIIKNLKLKLCKAAVFLEIVSAQNFSWTKSKLNWEKVVTEALMIKI